MTDITIINKKEGEEDEKGIDVRFREEQLQDQSKKARDFFAHLQTELDGIEGELKDGLSYLDMKNDTLLSYMIDLCNIILRKVRGETISGHSSVERCVTYRLILEKIKAIDQRLAYQLNKVISLPDGAEDGNQGINVENLDIDVDSDGDAEEDDDEDTKNGKRDELDKSDDDSDDDDEDDEDEDDEFDGSIDGSDNDDEKQNKEEDEEDTKFDKLQHRKQILAETSKTRREGRSKNSGIYKPPKLRSVAYGDDEPGARGGRRKDYNDFYQDDDNLDVVEESRTYEDEERTRYEEENYTRLPDDNPKKAKRKLKTKSAGGKGKKKFKGKFGKR